MDEFISVQVDNMIDTVASLATKQPECYIYIYIFTHHNANTLNAGDKMMLGHEVGTVNFRLSITSLQPVGDQSPFHQ